MTGHSPRLPKTLEPLDADLEVTGPIRATLYVRTTAPNTDFATTLWDIHPDGSAYHLSAGILRRSYGDHAEPPDPVRIELAMWPTSVLLPKGHALRLDISSSNYPRFDVNPNTGRDIATETEPVTADQTIFWGGDRRSQLVLPVVPR